MKYSKKGLWAGFAAVTLGFAPNILAADDFTLRIGSGHALGPVTYVNTSNAFLVPEIQRRVAERTEHTVKFIEAYGGTIAKTGETLEAVEMGILDMGHVCFCFEPAKAPVQNLNYFVPFSTPSAVQQLAITRAVYDAFPVMTDMFAEDYGQTLLALTGYDNYNLGTSFEWDRFADLEGHKIGGAGANLNWFEGSGMTVVQAGIPEFYTGVQTGVIEGASLFPSSYYGLKLHEIAPYYKVVDFGAMMVNGLFINNNTMDRLPTEVVDIIREVALEYEQMTAEALDASYATGMEQLQAAGARITTLSAEERQAWAERLATLPQQKADEFTALGYDGAAIFNAYFAAAEAAGFEFPVAYSVE